MLLEMNTKLSLHQKQKDAAITEKLKEKSQLALDRLRNRQDLVRQKNIDSFLRIQE